MTATLAALLQTTAAATPDAPALARGDVVTATYAEHADRSARIAGSLRNKFGLKPGDRVAIAMKNDPRYSEVMFGAWHAGCATVPMNAKLHPREFAWILENSGARVCFVSAELATDLRAATNDLAELEQLVVADTPDYQDLLDTDPIDLVGLSPDALAWLFYTSGTTGRPKGAMLSHGNLRAMNAAYFANVDDIAPGDCIIHAAPMSHGSGLYLLPHVERGACQVIPASGGFDPSEVMALLQSWRGATLFFAPTMVSRLINAPGMAEADLAGLKTIVYGGAPMYVEDCLKAIDRLGPKLVQIYGQGEAPMTITALPRAVHSDAEHQQYLERLASVGPAQTGVAVRIADEADQEATPGEVGEILVRGDVVMQGYWENPAATAEALRSGWLHTGDMGALDADGFLTLKDRSKDVIISGGSNIYPREVEEVLLRHEAVLECSVIGRPHPDWGEEVIAFIVPVAGMKIDEVELDSLCLASIARFKRPKSYRFIGELPKNNYGKVLKTELRQLAG